MSDEMSSSRNLGESFNEYFELLPALDEAEALEVAAIHSVASHVPLRHWPQRPFRQPHHSASAPALVGAR